jgi:hypothetical protein
LGHRPQEPLLVQAFVSELAVETLSVAVLHRPAWLDKMCRTPFAVAQVSQKIADDLS